MTNDPFTTPSDRNPGDFKRTPMGAPRVAHPDTGKTVTYRRPSGFAIDPNPYNLLKWKERQLAIGIGILLDTNQFPQFDPDDRDTIDRTINDAYDASQTGLAAERGTHLHLLTETVDRGEPYVDLLDVGELLGIPSSLQEHIIKRWIMFRQTHGLTAAHIEAHVVYDPARCAGTVDRHDILTHTINTPFGTLHAGQAVTADIKTGSLTLNRDGTPKYWLKYGPQLFIYNRGRPYDVDTDTRGEWDTPPHPDVAFIYHYDLKAALDGDNEIDWKLIPVNLAAAETGVQVAIDARDFAARNDLFAAPINDRRTQLLDRYHQLAEQDQRRYLELGIDRDDLDAVEAALDQVDPFTQTVEPPEREPVEPAPTVEPDRPADPTAIAWLISSIADAEPSVKDCVNRWMRQAHRAKTPFDPRKQPTVTAYERLRACWWLAQAVDSDPAPDTVAAPFITPLRAVDGSIGETLGRLTVDQAIQVSNLAQGFGDHPVVVNTTIEGDLVFEW